jgi:hypothetical protein
MSDLNSFALLRSFLIIGQISILNASSMFSLIDTSSININRIAQILVNINSIPNERTINSFNKNLSIKKRNRTQTSYSNILLTTFDSFLLLILLNPFNFIDLNMPVKVSRIIAAPTAINKPYIGANRRRMDADIY